MLLWTAGETKHESMAFKELEVLSSNYPTCGSDLGMKCFLVKRHMPSWDGLEPLKRGHEIE